MKKSIVILIHVGFWVCYLLLIIIILGVFYRSSSHLTDQTARIENALISLFLFATFPSVVTFYAYYSFLFPNYLQQKKIFLSIIYGLLISVGVALAGYILMRYLIETGKIADMDEGGKKGRSTALIVIGEMSFIATVSGIIALVIKGFITWFNEIKLKELLKEKNHEMEMALIKSKLDPHLLFNTINNIDTLILKDPVEASTYLNKLSDIIRFMLYDTKDDKISLFKEIEYIEKYIALQKIRTANDKYVDFLVTGTIGNKQIAPMIFIPFIENAFKHTNNKKLEKAISVSIIIEDETLQLVCENRFDSKVTGKDNYGGLGNELIQKRLNLIYAEKHTLRVNRTDDLYSVNLTIQNG
jgi:two-component system, LytTR family, sensor kinase